MGHDIFEWLDDYWKCGACGSYNPSDTGECAWCDGDYECEVVEFQAADLQVAQAG